MKKGQEYFVVEADSMSQLIEKVNDYLQNNWTLLGSPTIVLNQYTWIGVYYQAVIREVELRGPWD
jgi:hypothetical protein